MVGGHGGAAWGEVRQRPNKADRLLAVRVCLRSLSFPPEYINTYERAVFGKHKCTYDGEDEHSAAAPVLLRERTRARRSLSFLLGVCVCLARGSEYNQFMKIVLQIVAIINEKSYLQQQQEASSISAWSNASSAYAPRHRG